MHYVITGGSGFLGSNMVNKLMLQKNNKVTVVDDLSSGKLQNTEQYLENDNFKFIEQDIVQTMLNIEGKVDYVLNFASPASPPRYQKMPIQTLLVGSVGINNLIQFALEKNAVFLQTSTSEVYGDPIEHPQTEKYWGHVNPIGERACYDESKRFAEALITSYARITPKFKARIVRIFNTYGPNMDYGDGRVVPNFIHQALNNEDITVYGNGEQTRSFCYVDDQVRGILALAHSNEMGPINIGNPDEYTMLQLAETVIKLTNSKSKIIHKPLPKDDPTKRKPDITLAKQKLDWEPKVSLEEGLGKTIEWFKTQTN